MRGLDKTEWSKENAPVPERAPAFILPYITVFFPLEFLLYVEYNKRRLEMANHLTDLFLCTGYPEKSGAD